MNQEPNQTNKSNNKPIQFDKFIQNKVKTMDPNDEILTILVTPEEWEQNSGHNLETPQQLEERVKNWVQYAPHEKSQKTTQLGIIQYKTIDTIKQIQLFFFKSIYRVSLVQAVFGRQYDQTIKLLSRGRGTTLKETVEWNLNYWPQYIKYYGFKGIFVYISRNLDYRRGFQLIILSMTVGAGFSRFNYIQGLMKNKSTYVMTNADLTIGPKSAAEQRLLIKSFFGKTVDQITDKPIIEQFSPSELMDLQVRTKNSSTSEKYPFIGIKTKTDKPFIHPTYPSYETFISTSNDEIEGIKFALEALKTYKWKNLINAKVVTQEIAEQGNRPNPISKKSSLSKFFKNGDIQNFSQDGIHLGALEHWNTTLPTLTAKNVEAPELIKLTDPTYGTDKIEAQITNTKVTKKPNVIGKYLSALQSNTEIEFYKNDPELEPNGEVDLEDLIENPGDEIYIGSNKLVDSEVTRQFKDLELVGSLLPGLFAWYAAYNLYRFRLHFIYDIRKKPAPVLFTRYDHLGRLPGKVHLNEVMGVDGSGETIEKLFAALQRARGLGIYIPTVLHTMWETSLSQLVPGNVDNWVLNQRNKFQKSSEAKIEFANREPNLGEKLLTFHDTKLGFDPRFNFLKNAIKNETAKLKTLEDKNSIELYKKEQQISEQQSKLKNFKYLSSITKYLNIKALVKLGFKTLYLLETELSNAPIIAAIKPGRYGLNTLPKGMLLVGDPGNGRSFLARALASETRLPFFKTESNRFIDPKFGVIRLMSLFRRVRNEAPGILYIRDIDLITVDRERTNSPELIQLTTQFLICFDGYYIGSETRPTQRKIFTLGSVSDLSRMDPACLRSGRFEWIVNLRNPILGERQFLLEKKAAASNMQIEANIAWNYFGLMTEGFTNAEVISIINNSTLMAIRNETFIHTNESLNESFRNIFNLQRNNTVARIKDYSFFTTLHRNYINNAANVNYEQLDTVRPFRTKCTHLLQMVKTWNSTTAPNGSTVLTMKNFGLTFQTEPTQYSQKLISELVDFMSECAFIYQLRRCSPDTSFVTNTSYCEHLSHTLNKTFVAGFKFYNLERQTQPRIKTVYTAMNGTNWQNVEKANLRTLYERTVLLRKWYKQRMFCEVTKPKRIQVDQFGYNRQAQLTQKSSTQYFKNKINARLRESTNQYRTEYAIFGTIRGTYGTRGFQTRLQRPTTGPINQSSREFLELQLKM